MSIDPYYYQRLAQIESSNNPNAQAKTSSASGLYQFTKKTFERLGFDWGNRFDTNTQNAAIQKLTNQNYNTLRAGGVNPDMGSLYAAHFLGAGTAAKIYGAPDSADITSYVSSSQIAANPDVFKNIKTVGDFKNWSAGKFSSVGQSSVYQDLAIGNVLGAAGDLIGDIIGGNVGNTIKGVAGGAFGKNEPTANSVENAGAKVTGKTDDFIKQLQQFFSINTATRFVGAIVGIVLVAGAVWALLNSDKVIEQVNSAVAA